MIYYRIDPITNHLSEIAPFPFIDDKPYMSMEDDEFEAEKGYDGYKYLKSFMETEQYKKAEREFKYNEEIKYLRLRRERECFIYINRGDLWYQTLTPEQKIELNNWYMEWLNVTETLIIPEKPSWLN